MKTKRGIPTRTKTIGLTIKCLCFRICFNKIVLYDCFSLKCFCLLAFFLINIITEHKLIINGIIK